MEWFNQVNSVMMGMAMMLMAVLLCVENYKVSSVKIMVQAGVFALDVVMDFKMQDRLVMMEILCQTMDVSDVLFKTIDLLVQRPFRQYAQSYHEMFVGMDHGILEINSVMTEIH